MAGTLSQTQVKSIIQGAPAGTNPQDIVNELHNRGYQLEGLDVPAQSQPAVQPQASQPNVLQKAANALAPLGKDISQALAAPSTSKVKNFLSGGTSGATQAYQDSLDRNHQIDNQILQQAHAAMAAGNKDKANKLLKLIGVNPNLPTAEDIATNGQGYATNGQVVGDAAQTGLNTLSGGTLSGAGRLAGTPVADAAAKLLAPTAAISSTGGKVGTTAAKVLSGSALGAASGASNALSNKQDVLKGATQGAEFGAAIPTGIASAGALKDAGGKIVANAASTLSGAGAKALQEAASNPNKALISAMRSKTSAEDLLSAAQDAVQNVVAKQRSDYLAKSGEVFDSGANIDKSAIESKLQQAMKSFGISLQKEEPASGGKFYYHVSPAENDASIRAQGLVPGGTSPAGGSFDGVRNLSHGVSLYADKGPADAYARNLAETGVQPSVYKVKLTPEQEKALKTDLSGSPLFPGSIPASQVNPGSGGKVDLSGATISKKSAGDVQTIIDEVMNNKDWSVKGVDSLKQRVNDYVNYNAANPASSKTQAFIKQVARGITAELNKVPGYSDATKPYAQTSQFLQQLNKSVNTSDNASRETAVRKLLSVMKDSASPIRQALLEELDRQGGGDLTSQAAGLALSPVFPGGVQRALEGTGAAGAALLGLHPAAVPLAAGVVASSPRLSGEVAVKYGQANKAAGAVLPSAVRKLVTRQAVVQGSKKDKAGR